MEKITEYKKTVLENGITIVSEFHPAFYSSSMGIWVKCGSRYEAAHESGLSHFIEHMLFKGTDKRSAFDIAWQIDAVGGVLNAFTSRESTCYDVKVLSEHSPVAIDIVSDLFLNSTFEGGEFEKERHVILQEIGMTIDTPDDYIHDFFYETFWGNSGLGRQVTGTVETVSAFQRDSLVDFYKRMYSPKNIVIAAAGRVNHDEVVDRFSKAFSQMADRGHIETPLTSVYSPRINVIKKKLEQVHLSLGVPCVSSTSPDRYAAYLLNTILGEGMSSRLFQEVREKRGLVYNIYSYISTYEGEGLLGVYAGTGKKDLWQVIDLTLAEFQRMRAVSLSEEELESAKAQMKSNLLLGLENSDSRMHRLALNEFTFGREVSAEESIANIESVTAEEVMSLAERIFSEDTLSIAILGDVSKRDFLSCWEGRKGKNS